MTFEKYYKSVNKVVLVHFSNTVVDVRLGDGVLKEDLSVWISFGSWPVIRAADRKMNLIWFLSCRRIKSTVKSYFASL